MTTHTTTAPTTSVLAVARRAVASLLAALALAGALVVLTPQVAHADHTTTGVRFCTSGTSQTGLPAFLFRFNFDTRQWEYTGRNGTNGSTGCATFARVPTGHYYAVAVHKVYGTGSACLTNPYGLYSLTGWTSYAYATTGTVAYVGSAQVGVQYYCG